MEPISVVSATIALAAGIAKATVAATEISLDLREASDDVRIISNELLVFQGLVTPLTTGLSRFGSHADPSLSPLIDQISSTVTGAIALVERIESVLVKYRGRLTLWSKLRWSLFGSDQIRKLRESLESYKVALGIGLHVMSISIVGEVKDDAEVIHEVAEMVKILQKDEILGRLVTQAKPTESQTKVADWLEKMADYTTYAETAYQATIVDPNEEPARPITPIAELPSSFVTELAELPSSLNHSPDIEKVQDPGHTRVAQGGVGFGSQKNKPSIAHLSTVTRSDYNSTQISDTASMSRTTLPSSLDVETTSETSKQEKPLARDSIKRSSQSMPRTEAIRSRMSMDDVVKSIDWSPLIPANISETDFGIIQKETKVDMDAIQLSERKRHALDDRDRERLDSKLLRILSQEPGPHNPDKTSFCETLLGKGASIETSDEETINVVNQLIGQRDRETLSLLLRYGADPNGQTHNDRRQPLAVAASFDIKCLCALILAGAKINQTEPNDSVCSQFCESRIHCTPLLAAFAAVRRGGRVHIQQFWVTHFFLANGADVNFKSCTTVMDLMVATWPLVSQYRMTKHFINYGIDMKSPGFAAQIRQAAVVGEERLIQLLMDRGVDLNDVVMKNPPDIDPIVLAVSRQNWGCVEILVKAATEPVHLFSLVHVFMSKSSLDVSLEAFRRVIRLFLTEHPDIDLLKRMVWHYPRQMSDSGRSELVCETVAVEKLAESIFNENNRDRSEVLRLLGGEGSPRGGQQVINDTVVEGLAKLFN